MALQENHKTKEIHFCDEGLLEHKIIASYPFLIKSLLNSLIPSWVPLFFENDYSVPYFFLKHLTI